MKFRFIDQICSFEPRKTIQGIKAVSFEEYCLRAPFGGEESLPESLLTQGFIALADWLTMLSSEYSLMFWPETIERTEFHAPLKPGQRLFFTLDTTGFSANEASFHGQAAIFENGRAVPGPLAEIHGLTGRFFPAADYFYPPDRATLFSEIFKPLRKV